MPDTSSDSLDSLYRAAQLVSSSPEEADRLVRRVVSAHSDTVSATGMAHRLADAVSASRKPHPSATDELSGGQGAPPAETDAVMRAVIRRDIQRRIPDALATIDPERRVRLAAAIWNETETKSSTESGSSSDDMAVTDAFVRLVRAQLPWRRTTLSDSDYREMVVSSIRAFIEQNTEPASPTLQSELGAATRDEPSDGISDDTAEQFLRRSRRFALGLLLIVVAALLGTWLSTSDFDASDQPAPRLFDAIMDRGESSGDLVLQTTDAGQAERYVRDRFGWTIVVPLIEGASLQGVQSVEAVSGYELAVLRYQQAAEAPGISVFIIPYALIQQMRGNVVVDRSVLGQIADAGNFDVLRADGSTRIAWRHLDDVYVAVLSGASPGFEERITMP